MEINVVTIFPEIIDDACKYSIIGRAEKRKLVTIKSYDIRDYAPNKYLSVDDYAYGGGPGMILKPEPIFLAIEDIYGKKLKKREDIILLSPQGRLFTQKKAKELARKKKITLICGHYKGIDERVRENLVTDEISIGDYVLTGGEVPALVVIDSVVRLLPGAMSNRESYRTDSFYKRKMFDSPYYTKPAKFRDMEVPGVLLSGNHSHIYKWRQEKALENMYENRPDLFEKLKLSKEEKAVIERIKKGQE